MDEYIERDGIVSVLHHQGLGERGLAEKMVADRVYALLEIFPAANVAPVRHGRWYWADGGYCRCSECGQKAPMYDYGYSGIEVVKSLFCPQCGAKMDREADGHEK